MEKRLNGNFTRLLRKVLNVIWSDRMTNQQLYGQLPPITDIYRERHLRSLGHVWQREEQTLHSLLLWEPQHGKCSRGRPTTALINQICFDANLTREKLGRGMVDRDWWKRIKQTIAWHAYRITQKKLITISGLAKHLKKLGE